MKFRFLTITIGATLAFLFVIYTLYDLQIAKGEWYAKRVEAQYAIGSLAIPVRGSIFMTDKAGAAVPAAINKDYQVIFAVPAEIEDASEASAQIAALFGLSSEELLPRLSKVKDKYEALIFKATDAQVRLAEDSGIRGLYVASQRGRYYPFNESGAQVLGFVSHGDEDALPAGQYGIEKEYNNALTGSSDVEGVDTQLTIDQNIQQHADEIIKGLVDQYRAVGGSVIVQDPQTGKILAMTNYPTFDPNEYGKSPLANFLNPAVQGLYEPGSVFKPVTMAAGIDSGAITPETTYFDPGYFTADGKTIKNWDGKAHGKLTMTDVIEQSINTGTVFAEKKTGHKTFYNYLLKFGFKELTGIDLPGEATGRLTPLEKYPRDINFATASYGQGVAVTPIRLITSLSAIANGGVLHKAYVTEGAKSSEVRRVISEEAARMVTSMMVSAVTKAKIAAIPHYRVAGKTGTAFKPDFQKGGYTDKVINTYIGFAPASSPRFIVLIKLDEPENAPLAGTTVVPAFRDMAEFLINYYNIPPDDTN